jgi:hypothetical protein
MMISGAVLIPLVILLCAGFVCWKYERRRSASRNKRRTGTTIMMEEPIKKDDQYDDDTSEESPMTKEATRTDSMQAVKDGEDDFTSEESTAEGPSTGT